MLQPTPLEASAPAPPGEKADAVNTTHVHDGPTTLAVARPGDAVHLLLAEVCRSVGSGVLARSPQRQRPSHPSGLPEGPRARLLTLECRPRPLRSLLRRRAAQARAGPRKHGRCSPSS